MKRWNIDNPCYTANLQYGPRHTKTCVRACADSEGPDQHANSRSLIRVFTVRSQSYWILQNVWLDSNYPDDTMYMRTMTLNFAHTRRHIFALRGPVANSNLGNHRIVYTLGIRTDNPNQMAKYHTYCIYPKYLDTFTPYNTGAKIWTSILLPVNASKICWMSCHQCRPRLDAAFCGVWSGSTLFTQTRRCPDT